MLYLYPLKWFSLLLTENPTPLDLSNRDNFLLLNKCPSHLTEIMLDLISASEMSLRTMSQSFMLLFLTSVILKLSSSHICKKFCSSISFSSSFFFYFVYDRFLYHLKGTFIITLLSESIPWNDFASVVNIKLASLLVLDNKMPWVEVKEKS